MSMSIFPNHPTGDQAKFPDSYKSTLSGAAGAQKPIKNVLGQEELEAILSILPESLKLENVLDNFYYHLHDDKKLSQFSDFFSQILVNNADVFKNLDEKQKAQILFDQYRELTVTQLLKIPDYQTAYQSLKQKMEGLVEGQMLTEKIHKNYLSRVHHLHSDFVAFAIAGSLQSKPSLVCLSPDYQPRNLNLSHAQLPSLQA